MTHVLGRKLSTAWRTAAERGVAGVVGVAARRVASHGRHLRRWWYRDHAWLGWLVRLRGNQVRLDGCEFDVSDPVISDALRSRLLRGRYERSERALLARWLEPGAPVVELGGGIGVISTLVNTRLRQPDRHIVVEANPRLIPVIERQRSRNRAQFVVLHAALSYSGGSTTRLQVDDDFIAGRVPQSSSHDGIEVPATTLAALFASYPWTATTLVCDIEGLETDLVAREGEVLARHCATLVVEVHPEFRSQPERDAMFARLDELGFERVDSLRKVHAFRHRGAAAAP